MDTETQTAGTNTNDTGAATDSLLTGTAEGTPPAAEGTPSAAEGEGTKGEGTKGEGTKAEGEGTKAEGEGEGTKAEGEGEGDKPVEYTDFTLPEGVTLNEEAIGELKTLAKDLNLKQEDAQKFVDLGAKVVQNVEAGYAKQIEDAKTQWAADSTADKEFGGDNLQENLALAKRALDTFGTPELSKMLKESGLGNHPEIIRAFYRMGKNTSEDRLVAGTKKPAGAGDTAANVFYPTMTP